MNYRIVKSLVTDDTYLIKDDGKKIDVQLLEIRSQDNKDMEKNRDYLFANYENSSMPEIADLLMNPYNWRSLSHREVEEKYPGCFIDQTEVSKYQGQIKDLESKVEALQKQKVELTQDVTRLNRKLCLFIDNAKQVLKKVGVDNE